MPGRAVSSIGSVGVGHLAGPSPVRTFFTSSRRPKGRSRRRLGRLAYAPAGAPAPAGQTPVSWRENQKKPGRRGEQRSPVSVSQVQVFGSRSVIVRGRAEPVKSAFAVGFAADS